MSKKSNRAKRNRDLEEEFFPDGSKRKRSLRIEDIDIKAANERAAKFIEDVKEPDDEEKMEKAVDTFSEVLDTEKAMLELFSPDRLDFDVLYKGKRLKFHLIEVDGKADLKALDLNIHTDLSDLEMDAVKKLEEDLNPSERKLREKALKKLEEEMSTNLLEYTESILIQFVRPPKGTFEERKSFWKHVPFDLKMFIGVEAMQRLGLEPNSDIKLFPVSGTP